MKAVNNIFTWEPRLFLKSGWEYSQVTNALPSSARPGIPRVWIHVKVLPSDQRYRRERDLPLVTVTCQARASALFLGRFRVDAVDLLFVVLPRRLAHQGGCHTLVQLCLPGQFHRPCSRAGRQSQPPELRPAEAFVNWPSLSDCGLAVLLCFFGLSFSFLFRQDPS